LTRKSPPVANRHRNFLGALVASAAIVVSGCTLFSPKQGSVTDYEDARRTINNPAELEGRDYADENYRPEGVSAEKGDSAESILTRIGLRPKKQKDIDAARAEFAAADAQFDAARELPVEQRAAAFRAAAERYKLAADNWKSSALEQDALLRAAESHFFAEDYYAAEQQYAKLIKEYPRNPYLDHIDSRRFEIADYWLKIDAAKHKPFYILNVSDKKFPWNDTGGHGKRVFEQMRLDNPTGKVSDDATMRLAVEKFRKGDYEGAADTFADLRMTYPDSEHQFNAQLLELESLVRSYQGWAYTSLPLRDAEKRVKQIVRQFPVEAEKNQQQLNQTYAKIRFLRAERVWENAERRRKAEENGSARFQYQKLLDEYSDTPFAEQAETRMEEIKDAPDDPPVRFQPIIKLFGAEIDPRPWEKGNATGK